jgi:hypothetical protein
MRNLKKLFGGGCQTGKRSRQFIRRPNATQWLHQVFTEDAAINAANCTGSADANLLMAYEETELEHSQSLPATVVDDGNGGGQLASHDPTGAVPNQLCLNRQRDLISGTWLLSGGHTSIFRQHPQ